MLNKKFDDRLTTVIDNIREVLLRMDVRTFTLNFSVTEKVTRVHLSYAILSPILSPNGTRETVQIDKFVDRHTGSQSNIDLVAAAIEEMLDEIERSRSYNVEGG